MVAGELQLCAKCRNSSRVQLALIVTVIPKAGFGRKGDTEIRTTLL
jgi:hypothetical protein